MGRVVGFELNSQEPEKASTFYSEVFGWKVGEENWGYRNVVTDDDHRSEMNGGIAKGPQDYPHGIRIQIEVDSIDTTLELAEKFGAQIVREKMEFDDFYMAYIADPTGLGIGLIQSKRNE